MQHEQEKGDAPDLITRLKDERTRLREENERLRDALTRIGCGTAPVDWLADGRCSHGKGEDEPCHFCLEQYARAALDGDGTIRDGGKNE